MWLKFMEPEDWVHVRVMTKVSNDIAMVVEKKVVIPDTPRKKKTRWQWKITPSSCKGVSVSTNMVQICAHDLIGIYKLVT